MVDIHSHILHGIADSPADIMISLEIARQYEESGFTHVVSTPHFNPVKDNIEKFISDCEEKYAALNKLISDKGICLTLIPGAEVILCSDLLNIKDIDKLSIGSSKYLLVEFPWNAFPVSARSILYSLELQGFIPILAHPEKNYEIRAQIDRFIDLTETGLLIQIDAESLVKDKRSKKAADIFFRKNVVSFIATDVHRPGECFINFENAIKAAGRKYGSENIRKLLNNSSIIINNGSV